MLLFSVGVDSRACFIYSSLSSTNGDLLSNAFLVDLKCALSRWCLASYICRSEEMLHWQLAASVKKLINPLSLNYISSFAITSFKLMHVFENCFVCSLSIQPHIIVPSFVQEPLGSDVSSSCDKSHTSSHCLSGSGFGFNLAQRWQRTSITEAPKSGTGSPVRHSCLLPFSCCYDLDQKQLMELLVQEQTHASEHKSSGASSERHNMSTLCPSEAVAAPCSSSSLRPLHRAGSAPFRCHSDPVVALTPDATSLPQEP